MSCCRADCPQTAGKQGLKPPQSSPGSVLGGRGAHTPVQGHVCGAKPSQWSCGSCVCSSAGGQGSKPQIDSGQTPWACVYPTSHGVSCHPSAWQRVQGVLRECLCDFNTLTDRGVHSSCVHSCSSVISALLSLLFVEPLQHGEAAAPWKLLQLSEGLWPLQLVLSPSPMSWEPQPPLSWVTLQGLTVPLTRLLSASPDRGIIMTFGSGSNGCLGHGNFTDVSQVGGEGAGRAAPPG